MSSKLSFDRDRLWHWIAGAVMTWTCIFLLWGVLIFHLLFGTRITTILRFTGLACAIQIAITPWLFSTRVRPQQPRGRRAQRYAVVISWFSLTAILFFYFLQSSWPNDPDSRLFANVLYGTTVVFALVGLTVAIVSRRHKTL